MKFFDFLFNKPNDESAVVNTLSPIEQVVKESVEHLKKCSGTLTSEKLEAEAINLASYIFLRGNDKVQFDLDFLTKGLIDKIPSGDYTFADKVFPLMVKYGEGLYTEKHASFGKNQGYKLNVTIDPDLASFLKGYYKSVHKVNGGESKSSISKSNNAQKERVDLGLSSGILWATCNIGASSPSEIGDYFAWGEKEPKDAYGWDTYKLCRGSYNSIFKYTETDRKKVLDSQDDVAKSVLGGEWRIPTKEDMEELVEECEWKWTSLNGQLGWKVIGSNNNYIFLPASGAASSYRIAGVNELGRYWTATRDDSNYSAYNLRFKDGTDTIVVVDDTRFYGRTIRPVIGQPVKRIVKEEPKEEEQEKLPYPLKKITLASLLKNRMTQNITSATSYIHTILDILGIDRKYYEKFNDEDFMSIYNALVKIDALIPTQLGLSPNATRNAVTSRIAGLLAQSVCKENKADYNDNDAKFYALGGEIMWEMVEWQYIMIYCNFNTEKEKNNLIKLVNNAVEKAIIKMMIESEYSQYEQQCMIEGAKSIMLDKMVGVSVYGMLSRIFPTLF
ncbi:hypothetical protein AAAZ42_09740 [Bacteroides ovatus]|uniref:hypothetical protein n=1 Tax=Bacteroides ovatus TaxID=28116 RepID=UPI0032C09809